jgi:hypothetical protein
MYEPNKIKYATGNLSSPAPAGADWPVSYKNLRAYVMTGREEIKVVVSDGPDAVWFF